MNEDIVIDQLIADTIKEPLAKDLMEAVRSGHLCIKGKAESARVLQGDEQWFDEPIGQWEDLVYFQRCWFMESRVVRELQRLMVDVKWIDIEEDFELNQRQREAVKKGLQRSLFCLSGGPGTGKTHAVAELVRYYRAQGGDVILTAPTGKAVGQLKSRLNGIKSGTLHGLLSIRSVNDVLFGTRKLDAGMIVIDECSMIDVGMWGALLSAICEGTRVVLVGDHDQLPPVEAGTIYGEICGWMRERHPENYLYLDTCMRSNQTEILKKAEQIKRGEVIEVKELKDFDISEWKPHFKDKSFRILSCLRKGPYGVEMINQKLLELFQQDDQKGEWRIPIIVTKTSYEHEIYNGEMGELVKQSSSIELQAEDMIDFGEKSVPAMLLPGFEWAYAISVHKSQGSEYDHVVLIVPKGSEVFGREILYTGITRARVSLEVYAEGETLKICTEQSGKKLSGIRRKLECLSI